MQQVRALGRMPKASESQPKEQALARSLREAQSAGLMQGYEKELEELKARRGKSAPKAKTTDSEE